VGGLIGHCVSPPPNRGERSTRMNLRPLSGSQKCSGAKWILFLY